MSQNSYLGHSVWRVIQQGLKGVPYIADPKHVFYCLFTAINCRKCLKHSTPNPSLEGTVQTCPHVYT